MASRLQASHPSGRVCDERLFEETDIETALCETSRYFQRQPDRG